MRIVFEDLIGDVPVMVSVDVQQASVEIVKFVDTRTNWRYPWVWAARLTPEDVQRIERRAREIWTEKLCAERDSMVKP